MKTIFIFCVYLVGFLSQGQCAEVTLDVAIETPDLVIDCKYTIDKGEKFKGLIIKKDGQIFYNFKGKGKFNDDLLTWSTEK